MRHSKNLFRLNNINNIKKWFKMPYKCTFMAILTSFRKKTCLASSEAFEGGHRSINNCALVHMLCIFLPVSTEDDQIDEDDQSSMRSSFVVLTQQQDKEHLITKQAVFTWKSSLASAHHKAIC